MSRRSAIDVRVLIVALAIVSLAVAAYAAATFEYRFIDLAVYRWGGQHVLDATSIYAAGHPTLGMPFTYTPFAALVFVLLDALHLLEPVTWTILTFAALVRMSWLLARERGAWLAALHPIWPTIAIASGILISQPGTSSVRLGQVGFVLPWLICEDFLSRRERGRGIASAVATAIKLTPATYVLLWALVGRTRAFVLGCATIAASIALAWLLLPLESRGFWRHLGPDVTTVGQVTSPDHWSINGAVWRIFGDGGSDPVWLVLAITTLAGTLALGRLWWQRDARAGALGIVGLGTVLASPFSWSHHWIIVAPLAVGLLDAAHRARRPRLVHALLAGCGVLVCTSLWWHVPRELLGVVMDDERAASVAANTYMLVAVVLLGLAWGLRPRVAAVSHSTTIGQDECVELNRDLNEDVCCGSDIRP